MELFVQNIKSQDGKIVKTLFVKVDGVDTAIAYSRDYGFSAVYSMDRESEDNARAILEKAVRENYQGDVKTLMGEKA